MSRFQQLSRWMSTCEGAAVAQKLIEELVIPQFKIPMSCPQGDLCPMQSSVFTEKGCAQQFNKRHHDRDWKFQ